MTNKKLISNKYLIIAYIHASVHVELFDKFHGIIGVFFGSNEYFNSLGTSIIYMHNDKKIVKNNKFGYLFNNTWKLDYETKVKCNDSEFIYYSHLPYPLLFCKRHVMSKCLKYHSSCYGNYIFPFTANNLGADKSIEWNIKVQLHDDKNKMKYMLSNYDCSIFVGFSNHCKTIDTHPMNHYTSVNGYCIGYRLPIIPHGETSNKYFIFNYPFQNVSPLTNNIPRDKFVDLNEDCVEEGSYYDTDDNGLCFDDIQKINIMFKIRIVSHKKVACFCTVKIDSKLLFTVSYEMDFVTAFGGQNIILVNHETDGRLVLSLPPGLQACINEMNISQDMQYYCTDVNN